MSYSRRGRYDSVSPRRDRYESYSPRRHREDSYSPRRYRYDSYYSRRERSISRSYSRSRSRSRSRESDDVSNPGNNLYVTGLSPRITKRDLEEHFSKEGTVVECHLVVDPRTRESRGFGFVTMATIEDADRCIKYLDRSVLEGRVITVEKVSSSIKRFCICCWACDIAS
eukprot:TRINITY_DN185_c0_g1_i3.p1 TRINITY_DN185_c0_g1~~TRINITY_DN185_c0_g1_i3.p1  ORF type:complete len:169 (+),score=5.14 TRINITY_DN185_c0_g1_i3:234-740(+)